MTDQNKDMALEVKEKEKKLSEEEDKKIKMEHQKQDILKRLKISYRSVSKDDLIKIFKSWKITSDMTKDLKTVLLSAGEQYEDFDLSTIKYIDIIDVFSDDYIEFNNSRESLKETILKEYEIDSQLYEWRIKRKVDVLSNKDFKKILYWKAKTNKEPNEEDDITGWKLEREKFLKLVYWEEKVPNKRNTLNFLDSFDIEERRKKLTKSNKRALDVIVWSYQDSMSLNYSAIDTLFDLDIFSNDEKLDIINTFAPTITLDKLITSWIVSKNTWKQIKDNIVKENLERQWVLYKDNEIRAISSKIRDDRVNVSTDKYIKSEKDINNFVESWWLKVVSLAYNDMLKKVKEENWDIDKFKTELNKLGIISNPENFKVWNTLVIRWNTVETSIDEIEDDYWTKSKSKTKKEVLFFAKIVDDWSWSWIVRIEEKWVNIYNDSLSKESDFSYDSFLGLISWKSKIAWNTLNVENVAFLTTTWLKDKLRKWDIKSESDIIEFKDKSEELSQAELENSTKYQEEEGKIRNSDEYIKKEKEEWFEVADNWLKEELEKNSELNEIWNNLKDLEDFNLKLLLDKLNDLDKEWVEFWLEVWTSFEAESWKWKPKWIYTVAFVDKEKKNVKLNSPSWPEEVDFQSFYQTFKEKWGKRTSNIKGIDDLLNSVQGVSDEKISWPWSNFEIKSNQVSKKENDFKYDFLVQEWWKWKRDLLKVHSISWNLAKISFWDVTVTEWKDKSKNTVFETGNESYEVSLWYLHNYIIEHWLIPKSLKEEKNTTQGDSQDWIKERHWSLASKLFKNLSISDVLAWFKLWVDSIEQYLKEWNDEHAAKFANWVFWKFLPAELKTDLLSRVESAQKKRMEEYSTKLKDLDSPAAVSLIKKWLLNRDTPEYKREAWMMFMLEKYWNLYTKWPLYEYKNQFLWYEAFWWKVWDKEYMRVKGEMEWWNIPFTEEQLMYEFLKKQCWAEWYNWIKRRWRLHKEFKKMRSVWKEEEYQTWLTDWGDERTIEGRLEWWYWELKWWSYSNAMWFLEKAIEKWWTYEQMNMIPFVMMFSWVVYGFERSMTDKIKNFCGKWMLVPLTRFMSYKWDISLANDTILALSHRISDLKLKGTSSTWYPLSKMWWEAEVIFNNISKNSMSEIDKLNDTKKFYEKYWKELTDALYLLNNWDTWANADLNKLIFLEKDSYRDESWNEQKWNSTFKKYYDTFSWLMDADTAFDKNEDLATDSFKEKWASSLDLKKVTVELLNQGTVWNFRHKWWAFMWNEISTEFDAITRRDYRSHWWDFAKKKILKDMLRKLSSWMLESYGSRVEVLQAFNKPWNTFATKFNKWWLRLSEFTDNGISYDVLLKGDNDKWEEILERVAENMIEQNDMSEVVEDYNWYWLWGALGTVKSDVQEATKETLSY